MNKITKLPDFSSCHRFVAPIFCPAVNPFYAQMEKTKQERVFLLFSVLGDMGLHKRIFFLEIFKNREIRTAEWRMWH
jgi:hypothetical protein